MFGDHEEFRVATPTAWRIEVGRGWGPQRSGRVWNVQLSWSNGNSGRLVSGTLTTLGLSSGSKDQLLLLGRNPGRRSLRGQEPCRRQVSRLWAWVIWEAGLRPVGR